jgi:predicted transcriptional regulator
MDLQEALLNKVTMYLSSSTNQIMKEFFIEIKNLHMSHRPMFTFLHPFRKFHSYHSNNKTILFDYDTYWEPYLSDYESEDDSESDTISDYDSDGNVYNAFQCFNKYLNSTNTIYTLPLYKLLQSTPIDLRNSGAQQILQDYCSFRHADCQTFR